MNSEPYDQIDDSMLDLFRIELESHSRVLENELIAVEKNASPERVESLMRAAHSIKGAARIIGLAVLADMAHQMENVFVAVQERKHILRHSDVDVLLLATGLLTELASCDLSALGGMLQKRKADMLSLADKVSECLSDEEPENTAAEKATEEVVSEPPSMALEDMSLLDIFKIDLETHSRNLEQGLLDLENHGGDDVVESLMRAAHSIKGSSRIVGLEVMGVLAHAMEDLMQAVQRGDVELDSSRIDALLQANDLFQKAAALKGAEIEAEINASEETYRSLASRIQSCMNKGSEPEQDKIQKEQPVAHAATSNEQPSTKAPRPSVQKAGEDSRVVRVQADSLSRLMGLAGEFLVQARSMKKFSDSLQRVKNLQRKLGSDIEHCAESCVKADHPDMVSASLDTTRRELDEAQNRMLDCIQNYESFSRRLEQLSDRLYREVITSRMRPFEDGLHGFARMVRDLARQLGKEVEYCVEGGDTPVDRDILERMEAPLTHLVRNAMDHGLETPDEREKQGKSRQGIITLDACHRAGMLHITVRDNGRGIDLERLRSKAVERGHVPDDMAGQLSEEELLQFLFLPGFSTAEAVTDISGRGVGLDVVHAMVREVGGSVHAASKPNEGTSFQLELPLTLSVLRALVVSVSGQQFALPLSRIDRVLRVPEEQVETLEDRRFFTLEEQHIGLIPAAQVLELPVHETNGADHYILIISDSLNCYGIEVEGLIGQRDLVVLPLDTRLGKVPDVSAGAVREDGTPLLILDVDDMVRSIDHLITFNKPQSGSGGAERGVKRNKHILVVDDSLTVREVERKLLTGKGYDVTVAVDGMDGWNMLQGQSFDLVVTDVDMPRMNGIQLVERIRAVSRFNDLPVMIVSYKDREEDRMRGLQAGANYYLTKSSFHDERLLEAVVDLIGDAS